jgi:hypothetical protein
MKRVGPWMFAAGLVVLCAGIASTRSPEWKKPNQSRQTIALDMDGVDTLDVGDYRYEQLVFSDLPPAMDVEWYGVVAAGNERAPITAARKRNSLRLEPRSPAPLNAQVRLQMPPTLAGISGRVLGIKARTAVGALRIETSDLDWEGDAEALDIHARDWPDQSPQVCTNVPEVAFEGGKVARLRISIERGAVYLGDLSQVGLVEVHAGPGVGLQVGRIDDLPRIKLLAFDGVATEAPPAATRACPNRRRRM